jgi:uncharacterized membrane protein YebE (DUF533 family)
MDGTLLAAILGSGGAGAILAAIVTGLFSKRKLGAEATEIITKAAAGVVTNMQAEIDRQVKRNDDLIHDHKQAMRDLVEAHNQEMENVRRVLQLHVAWDAIAISKMNDMGIHLPPPPPLLPPTHLEPPELD